MEHQSETLQVEALVDTVEAEEAKDVVAAGKTAGTYQTTSNIFVGWLQHPGFVYVWIGNLSRSGLTWLSLESPLTQLLRMNTLEKSRDRYQMHGSDLH